MTMYQWVTLEPGYVWCDYHGEIHPREQDYYDSAEDEECQTGNWRHVYIQPDFPTRPAQ